MLFHYVVLGDVDDGSTNGVEVGLQDAVALTIHLVGRLQVDVTGGGEEG